jgi:hypothetical protein
MDLTERYTLHLGVSFVSDLQKGGIRDLKAIKHPCMKAVCHVHTVLYVAMF